MVQLKDRLFAALRQIERDPEARGATAWLANRLGISHNAAAKLLSGKSRAMNVETAGAAVAAFGHDLAYWQMHEQSRATPKRMPPFEGAQSGASLAQQVSHPIAMMSPTTIAWELLMSLGSLPELFCVTLQDDAMAPEFPRGCTVTFSTREGEPRPRDAVLVRDAAGHLFFREYQLRTPGHWVAAATGGGLLPLDSHTDGLQVLAICMGKWGRRG